MKFLFAAGQRRRRPRQGRRRQKEKTKKTHTQNVPLIQAFLKCVTFLSVTQKVTVIFEILKIQISNIDHMDTDSPNHIPYHFGDDNRISQSLETSIC